MYITDNDASIGEFLAALTPSDVISLSNYFGINDESVTLIFKTVDSLRETETSFSDAPAALRYLAGLDEDAIEWSELYDSDGNQVNG